MFNEIKVYMLMKRQELLSREIENILKEPVGFFNQKKDQYLKLNHLMGRLIGRIEMTEERTNKLEDRSVEIT